MPQLNFVKQGRGPVVVLSHSLGSDLGQWDEVAARLQPRCTVLRYDHRGHGRSQVAPSPYTLEALAADAAALISEHARSPVTFVGLGMGGMVGQQLAVHYPHWIKGLVMAHAASAFNETLREVLRAHAKAARERGMAAIVDETLPFWFTPEFLADPGRGAASAAAARERFVATDATAYAASCESMTQMDFGRTNPLIACPTLVIGGRRDINIPVALTEALCRTISGAEMRVIDAARHSPVERPDEFAGFITEFLDHHR